MSSTTLTASRTIKAVASSTTYANYNATVVFPIERLTYRMDTLELEIKFEIVHRWIRRLGDYILSFLRSAKKA